MEESPRLSVDGALNSTSTLDEEEEPGYGADAGTVCALEWIYWWH